MPCGEDYFLTEKEKNEIVSGKYLYALTDFSLFKKWESYWLEYVGDDTYVGRSDNILNIKVVITPYQLANYFSETEPSAYEKCLAEWFYGMRTWGLTHSEDGETCENFTDSQAHKAINDLQKYILNSHSDGSVIKDTNEEIDHKHIDEREIEKLQKSMKTKTTDIFRVNLKHYVVADTLEKAIEVYRCKYPDFDIWTIEKVSNIENHAIIEDEN